jgi:ribosome-binding ATPase YchF (GTP1/OBG family)
LQLRGHICLWISTLRTSKTNDDDDDDDWDMDATERLDESNLLSAAEQLTQLNSCQRDLQQAQQFLFKAESHGAPPQKATMASIEIKLRQLARQLAKLRTVGED